MAKQSSKNVSAPPKDKKYEGFNSTRRPNHRNGKPANMTGIRTDKFSPRGRGEES